MQIPKNQPPWRVSRQRGGMREVADTRPTLSEAPTKRSRRAPSTIQRMVDRIAARVHECDHEVLDPAPVELARQPLMAVEVDLHLEREPGLQLDVDEPQLAIHEVVIELQT